MGRLLDEDVVSQVVQVALKEHTNIAETLHHTIFQDWSALQIRIGTMGTTTTEEQMQELQSLVARATHNLQDVLNTLRPARGPGGLSHRLGILTRVFSDHLALPVSPTTIDEGLYPPEVEAAALSAAQQVLAVACVVGKPHTSLSLHHRNAKLRLILELAGCSEKLVEIQERLASLNASVEAEASAVSILFEFPLTDSPEKAAQ